MRTLVLIRHGKAEDRGRSPGGDHDRVLVDRGRSESAALGQRLRAHGWGADLCLVSTAARAAQTLAAALGEHETEIWTTRQIYDGGVDGVLAAVQEVPEGTGVLWVVGHEPVLSTLTWDLAEPTLAGDLRGQLSRGLPTASAAVLETEGAWRDLAPGGARVTALGKLT